MTSNLIDGFAEWEVLEQHACEGKTYLANHPLDFNEDTATIIHEFIQTHPLCIGHENNLDKIEVKSQNYLSESSIDSESEKDEEEENKEEEEDKEEEDKEEEKKIEESKIEKVKEEIENNHINNNDNDIGNNNDDDLEIQHPFFVNDDADTLLSRIPSLPEENSIIEITPAGKKKDMSMKEQTNVVEILYSKKKSVSPSSCLELAINENDENYMKKSIRKSDDKPTRKRP